MSGSLIAACSRVPCCGRLVGTGSLRSRRGRCNQVVYFTPRRQHKGRGRKKTYGAKCRMDKLLARFPERLRHQQIKLHVQGRERDVQVADAEVLLRGVSATRPLVVRVIVVTVAREPSQAVVLVDHRLGVGGRGSRARLRRKTADRSQLR